MDGYQAIQILDQITAQVQLPRQGHANAMEALRVLKMFVDKDRSYSIEADKKKQSGLSLVDEKAKE